MQVTLAVSQRGAILTLMEIQAIPRKVALTVLSVQVVPHTPAHHA
jgi:hypothetical protein